MRVMYCWRCGMDVPMFNEEEFSVIEGLYAKAVRAIKDYCRTRDLGMDVTTLNERTAAFIEEQYRTVLEAYRRITGQHHATAPTDLMHHRISDFGPPCSHCGKPLRTSRATYYLGRQEAHTSPERQRRDPVAGAPGLWGSFVPR